MFHQNFALIVDSVHIPFDMILGFELFEGTTRMKVGLAGDDDAARVVATRDAAYKPNIAQDLLNNSPLAVPLLHLDHNSRTVSVAAQEIELVSTTRRSKFGDRGLESEVRHDVGLKPFHQDALLGDWVPDLRYLDVRQRNQVI